MRTISYSVQKSRSDIGKSLKNEKKFIGFLKKTLYCFIRFYQICISPLHPPCCRYYPTCSNYAIEAITKYGPFKGVGMAGLRILRCHPFAKGGYDPVP